MGTEFTGGGFAEFEREARRVAALAAKGRLTTEAYISEVNQDRAEQQRLAARARTAATRNIAAAETVVARGAETARARPPVVGPGTRLPSGVVLPPGVDPAAAQRRTATALAAEQSGFVRAARGSEAYSTGITRAATSHSVLNAQMSRHGALSSEFIEQLSRGNVGLKELGQNLTVTAGKFGGWLLAGAGIFAVLGALGKIGTGAIDAASGVNQLQRVVADVDPQAAQAGFRSLSTEFNLPIATVTDAVYQMGKVFHNTDEALLSSRSILYAVKVGELDVATSTRYLTAIVNGFNLTASEQQVVFDQMNQAQNKYNISISNVLAGTSKAAGAFRLAGGDVTHLIALITTLSKATGQTGDVIGTAIQRSPHFIAMPKNQDVLQSFGINSDAPITAVYDQAIKRAEHLAPDKQRQLAEALFGPQYGARVGVALLQQGPLLAQVLKDVSPENASGSAKRELDTLLGSFTERITKIGTELGALGSNLAQSGFLDLLGLGVALLSDTLSIVNTLLDTFNGLPEPLKHALAIMLQLYGVFRLLRHFNVGRVLPEGAPGRAALTQPDFAQRSARETNIVRQGELRDSLVSSSRAVTTAEIDRAVALEQQAEAQRRGLTATQAGAQAAKGAAGASQTSSRYSEDLANADRNLEAAKVRESVIASKLAQAEREQKALSGRRSGLNLPVYAQAPGTVSATGVDTAAINRSITSTRARLRTNISNLGLIGGSIQTAGQEIGTAASRAANTVRSNVLPAAAARVRTLGTGLRRTASNIRGMVGPLEVLAAAGTLLITAAVQAQQKNQSTADAVDQFKTIQSNDDFAAAQEALRAQTDQGASLYEHLFTNVESNQEAALAVEAEYRARLDKIDQRLYLGQRIPQSERALVGADTLQQYALIIKKQLGNKAISQKQANDRIQNLIDEAYRSPNVEDPAALEQQLRSTGVGDQAQANATMIQKRAELAAAHGPLYDTVGNARRAAQAARQATDAVKKGGGSPEEVLDARIQQAQAEKGLKEAVNDRAVALSEAAGAAALSRIDPDRGVARARQELVNAKAKVALLQHQNRSEEEIKSAITEQRNAQFSVEAAVQERMLNLLDITTRLAAANAPLYAPLAAETTALKSARQKLAILQRTGATGSQIKDAQAGIAEAERALQLSQNQRAQDLLEVAGEIALTGIDPKNTVGTARQALTNAQSVLALMEAQGRDKLEIQRAFLAVSQAEVALGQAIEQRADAIRAAQFDIQTARAEAAGNEVRAAAIAARQAIYALSHADTRQERLSAQAALRRARTGKRDAIFQTEVEDIQFGADIGRLTIAEQIKAYERLLRTLQLNRDMRRDLRSRIAQLKKEADGQAGDFELRVGEIRLPTLYEITRAIGGGVNQSSSVSVVNHNNVRVDGSGDPEAVGAAVLGKLGGGTKAALRSAGLR